jgi:transcriptional regulator with XRE-family HTH domain
MSLKLNLPNRTGDLISARMRELKLSIADVAKKLGTSYEHIRKLAKGQVVPSKSMVKSLAVVLKIEANEFERVAIADRIRLKFGTIPLEMAGKNPELEPLERVWNHLSQDHKADLIAQAEAWAKRDRETAKKH